MRLNDHDCGCSHLWNVRTSENKCHIPTLHVLSVPNLDHLDNYSCICVTERMVYHSDQAFIPDLAFIH